MGVFFITFSLPISLHLYYLCALGPKFSWKINSKLTGVDEPKGEHHLGKCRTLKRERIDLIKYSKYFRIRDEGKTMHLNP